MSNSLDLNTLRDAVMGRAAAFRCVTDYQPAGGPGDKVFPPTYDGGKYATEERLDPETGEIKPCVLLDSVQSQANRMELALLEAHRAGKVALPLIVAHFNQPKLLRQFTVTSLEAPHRAADALFRDSRLNGVMFRQSDKGKILDTAEIRNATGLFGLCPTALVFGLWDSTGPRGGQGTKFQRALVSEIIGYDAIHGVKTVSRIDPAGVVRSAGPIFRTDAGGWTPFAAEAKMLKGKPVLYKLHKGKEVVYDEGAGTDVPDQGRPSVINHGNVTPDYDFARDRDRGNEIQYDERLNDRGEPVRIRQRIRGGFTISKAAQTTVLSLAVLRRLRFPINGADSDTERDVAARTVLAALGIAGGTLARDDVDLRSRCHLFAEAAPTWELLDRPAKPPRTFDIEGEAALQLLADAVDQAKSTGLPWEGEIELTPSENLVELVKRSQEEAEQD